MLINYFFLLMCSLKTASSLDTVTIQTNNGQIIGYRTSLAKIFYGVPYAQPPIGLLRWSPPVPVRKWSPNRLNATQIPAACPQSACDPSSMLCPKTMSEDCLYLNVFVPLRRSSSLRPVMIFIHGGNFQYGSASLSVYTADRFVQTNNVLCVLIQYRMGILGFLATGTGANDLKGNYGILDQRLAIAWVKANIRAFGGNPNKITLFGQSAGAQSVSLHYLTKSMQPFFQAAIIQSSPMTIPFKTYADYSLSNTVLAERLNCTTGNTICYRQFPYQDIIDAQNVINGMSTTLNLLQKFEPWTPVIDNSIVPDQLLNTISNVTFSLKPLIIGTTSEEGRSYVYETLSEELPASLYSLAILVIFGSRFLEVLQRFPAQGSGDQRSLLSRLVTQWVFACSTRSFARLAGAHIYVFNYPVNSTGIIDAPICNGYPCHGYELPLVFQSIWVNRTNEDHYISRTMATYWTNFAKTTNPNKPVNMPVQWLKMNNRSADYLFIDDPIRIQKDYLLQPCNFWDKIGYY